MVLGFDNTIGGGAFARDVARTRNGLLAGRIGVVIGRGMVIKEGKEQDSQVNEFSFIVLHGC